MVQIINAKLTLVQQVQPVPFHITICNTKINAIILRTAVNYGSTYLSNLKGLFRNNSLEGIHAWHSVSYMAKWYHRPRTNRISLAEIGQYVEQVEFSPETHCILGWFTSTDARIFRCGLLRSPVIFNTTPSHELFKRRGSDGYNCLQLSNLAMVFKACSGFLSVAVPAGRCALWATGNSTSVFTT